MLSAFSRFFFCLNIIRPFFHLIYNVCTLASTPRCFCADSSRYTRKYPSGCFSNTPRRKISIQKSACKIVTYFNWESNQKSDQQPTEQMFCPKADTELASQIESQSSFKISSTVKSLIRVWASSLRHSIHIHIYRLC